MRLRLSKALSKSDIVCGFQIKNMNSNLNECREDTKGTDCS